MPEDCDGTAAPTWQVTGAVDTMSTTIVFAGVRVPLRETAVTATLSHFATARLGWSITAGGIVAGSIEGRDIRDGATASASASYLALYESATRPFVAVSGSFGSARIAGTADDGSHRTFNPWDLRGGAIVGKSLGKRVVPYLAARGFGGPVYWYRDGASVTGSDRWHVTAGVGATIHLPARVDLSLEVMPLGEQSATAGVTARF